MRVYPNTVPQSLTPELLTFCKTIADADPAFIISVPPQGASAGFCFGNVDRKVRKNGGAVAYGWAVWHFPSFYFEAEHHAVWRNKRGDLIDVSPQLGGRRRMLFLPDDSATYDPMLLRQNILHPDGSSPRALRMTELGRQRHALMMRCRIPGTPEIRLYEAEQLELADIDKQINLLTNA